MINTTRTINNKLYDVVCFHPTAFEERCYTVRFYESGKELMNKYMHSIMVEADSEEQAIILAIKDIRL